MKKSYLFQLILQQLGKRKITYGILAFQVAATSFLIVFCTLLIRFAGYTYQTVNDFRNHEMMLAAYKTEYTESSVGTFRQLSAIENVAAENIYQTSLYTGKDLQSNETVFVYQDIMTKNMVLRMKKGKQLSEAQIKDGAIPILVPEFSEYAEKYDTGEHFVLYYPDRSLSQTGFLSEECFQPITFYVCGVIRFPYRIYMQEGSNLPLLIENFLNEPHITTDTFFAVKDFRVKDNLLLSELNSNVRNVACVEITAPKGSAEYETAYSELTANYGTMTVDGLLEVGYENYSEASGDYIVALIILCLLSVAGISGINLFLGESLKQEYSLYFMCGAKWSECVKIEALRSLFIIVVPTFLGTAAGYIFSVLDDETRYFADPLAAAFTVIFIIMIYAVTSCYFIVKLKNTKPIDNIRLMEKE